MAQTCETRRAGGAAGLGKLSFPGGNDDWSLTTNRPSPQAEIAARLRRQRHVECLHRLGPSPLGHFITEIERGADIDASLEAYARLDADFIKALGGDQFAPAVHVIDGGGR